MPPLNRQNISAISWASFFCSFASLLVFSVLPVFSVEVLGMSHSFLGGMEGLAIFSSFVAKVGVGIWSDILNNRRRFIVVGCLLSLLAKPIFALSATANMLFFARFFDRMAKGIRSAPMDALVSYSAEAGSFGRAFGVRQALYTLGAVVGAGAAVILLKILPDVYRTVFWLASLPATAALVIVVFGVREQVQKKSGKTLLSIKDFLSNGASGAFWKFLAIVWFLMLARFSEAFITLKARGAGWEVSSLPLIVIVMDLIHAFVAARSRTLADRWPVQNILVLGMGFMILAQGIFAAASSDLMIWLAISTVGVHMGLTQGALRATVALTSPRHAQGTAFSCFYLTSGLGVLFGNWTAGFLSDRFNIEYAFLGGLFFALIALFLTLLFGSDLANAHPAAAPRPPISPEPVPN